MNKVDYEFFKLYEVWTGALFENWEIVDRIIAAEHNLVPRLYNDDWACRWRWQNLLLLEDEEEEDLLLKTSDKEEKNDGDTGETGL